MTTKYVTGTINHWFYDQENELEKNIFYGVYFSAGSITQWIYASQYMKTCILIPGLFNKANLLTQRYIAAIEREHEFTTSNDSFLRKNSEIDADIKAEKERNRKIDKNFYRLDIAVVIAILCCNGLFEYLMNHTSKRVEHPSQIAQQFFFPTLDVLTALILAFSANYLSKQLHTHTGQKQNLCLIIWHIANLSLEVVALTLVAIFYVYDDIQNTEKADYYWMMTAKSQ